MRRGLVQVMLPSELQDGVSAHIFWNRETTAMFDKKNANLNASYYLCMIPENSLEKADKYKKEKYFRSYLERRCTFTQWSNMMTESPVQRP